MPLQPTKAIYKLTRKASQTKVHQYVMNPAPTMGLDVSQPLTDQDPKTALELDNFFVRRYGVELRPGSLRWVSNLGNLSPVLSLMAYNPPRGALEDDIRPRLFAACADSNIYEVTDQSDESVTPPVSVTINGQKRPGVFSWTNYATAATNYLVICNAGGGVWTFDTLGGWVERTPNITTDPPPTTRAQQFDFVMTWKNRLWFIEDVACAAYYSLNPNTIQGEFHQFDFGPLLVHGGDLQAAASWTIDGGNGIDDKLVVYGSGGDVLIYEGTDPTSSTTFRIVGRWFGGRPPDGRRFMSKYGGDLVFVSEMGVEHMSRLLQAQSRWDPTPQRHSDPSRRYNEVIGRDVRDTRGKMFWRWIWLPSEESAILSTPHNVAPSGYQYCFNALGQAWSRHVGMGMSCAEEFMGDLYHGTLDGKVIKAFVGSTDDYVSAAKPGRGVIGVLQSAFVAPNGDRMALKRPQLAQVLFNSISAPKVKFQINTEFTFEPVPGSPAYIPTTAALWDHAKWDEATWSAADQTYGIWAGVSGLGAYASIRLSLQAAPRTVFAAWKYVYEPGGIM